jgi:hypothetical protein
MKVEGRPTVAPANGYTPGVDTQTEQVPVRDEITNGETIAAMIAAGIGALALGFFTTLAEILATSTWRSSGFPGLTWDKGVGPLSGKTGYAVIIWLISWAVLYFVWRGKNLNFSRMFWVTLGLIGLGVLGTFPVFFELFTAH